MNCYKEKSGHIYQHHFKKKVLAHLAPILCIINTQEKSGTTSSTLLSVQNIKNEVSSLFNNSILAIVVLAPTGVVAFNINGGTIHSKLSIPIINDAKRQDERLKQLQNSLKEVRYVIIDEITNFVTMATIKPIELSEAADFTSDFQSSILASRALRDRPADSPTTSTVVRLELSEAADFTSGFQSRILGL
ncbi:AAA family ATPase [Rhizophagus irregularis DAOM 181602=DAOM 197198]|nr:AAA family ATPase [Rhizophagus irregularis DAOM 181602=DAOM 197198]